MKANPIFTAEPQSDRAKATRENQIAKLAHVRELIEEGNTGNRAARNELLRLLNKAIAYHNSGKIEGLHSLDTACSNNDFCPHMQGTEDPAIICKYCYTESLWDSAKFAHHITGEILSGVELTPAEAARVFIPATTRYNSDGELINLTHAINLIRITAGNPDETGTIYTKRPEILDKAIAQEGKPANLVCGVSSLFINQPRKKVYWWTDFIFTVYTPEGMKRALARGEHECNGKKCIACGFYCYRRHEGAPVYVAEALRRPKGITAAQFPAIIAAIDAATLDK